VRYARRIQATICAEGIETLEDLERLADLDVTFGQGWAIGRPAAPWAPVADAAADRCRTSAHSLIAATSAGADDALGRAADALSHAYDYDALAAAVAPVVEDLRAAHVVVYERRGDTLVAVDTSAVDAPPDAPVAPDAMLEGRALQVVEGVPGADPRAV